MTKELKVLPLLTLNLHDNGNNSTSLQRKRAVSNNLKNRLDSTTVRSNRNVGASIRTENVLKSSLQTDVTVRVGLPNIGSPKRVLLSKSLFGNKLAVSLLEVSFGITSVTSVNSDGLSESLLLCQW